MDYDDYKREETQETYARQFKALHDLGMDAAALAAGSRPDVAQMAEELRGAAERLEPQYAVMSLPLRGVALARMLAVVARLFELGQSLALRSRASASYAAPEDDLILLLPELLPQVRGCAKFLSDEIAAYALFLVQDEDGAKTTAAAAFRQDCWLADQISADHQLAQAIHDRDAAYAAERARLCPTAGALERGADPWSDPEADDGWWGPGEYPADEDGADTEDAGAEGPGITALAEIALAAEDAEVRGIRGRVTRCAESGAAGPEDAAEDETEAFLRCAELAATSAKTEEGTGLL